MCLEDLESQKKQIDSLKAENCLLRRNQMFLESKFIALEGFTITIINYLY